MQLAETFDQVADLYDATRPGYPTALFETLVRAGGLEPGDPVLEVGCGTGQATEGLRRQGLALTALDPGPDLIRHARRRFGDIGGQSNVFFVMVVAAAEVVVGLGIIVAILRRKPGATTDDLAELKG